MAKDIHQVWGCSQSVKTSPDTQNHVQLCCGSFRSTLQRDPAPFLPNKPRPGKKREWFDLLGVKDFQGTSVWDHVGTCSLLPVPCSAEAGRSVDRFSTQTFKKSHRWKKHQASSKPAFSSIRLKIKRLKFRKRCAVRMNPTRLPRRVRDILAIFMAVDGKNKLFISTEM